MPRALIIGAGPAGTVAGMALAKAGWEPVIYEAYEHSAGLDQGVDAGEGRRRETEMESRRL